MGTYTVKNLEDVRKYIEHIEGRNLNRHVVDDTDHIGIGHNLEQKQTPEELAIIGSPFVQSITDEQCDALFAVDVQDALNDIQHLFREHEWDALSEVRQGVIISQAFQLGGPRLSKFEKMLGYMKQGDWGLAAAESLDSIVARQQTPDRWKHQAQMLENNTWDGVAKVTVPDPEPTREAYPEKALEAKVHQLMYDLSQLRARVEALETKPTFTPHTVET